MYFVFPYICIPIFSFCVLRSPTINRNLNLRCVSWAAVLDFSERALLVVPNATRTPLLLLSTGVGGGRWVGGESLLRRKTHSPL